MANISVVPMFVEEESNVIDISVIKGGKRFNADGSVDRRHSNAKPGVSEEVYPFTEDEVARIINVLNRKIDKAVGSRIKIARRNKLLAIIGMNTGLRASDIRRLPYSFFFNERGEMREFYSIEPFKTRKYKKFVKIFFNDTVKEAIQEYVSLYPVNNYDDLVFASQKGDGAIEVHAIYDIIKKAAAEAGVEKNIGSHSLRKTWGYTVWHSSEDKNKALVILQQCFGHSSTQVTARYIGIMDNELSDMYNSVNIGYGL